MNFEWDENKNRLNINKHGISFQLAAQVLLISARRATKAEEELYYDNL